MKKPEQDGKLRFVEDDCLQHDPTYPGIKGWWKEQFGPNADFDADWKAAQQTEKDHGDSFERLVTVVGKIMQVTYSFDGYSTKEVG